MLNVQVAPVKIAELDFARGRVGQLLGEQEVPGFAVALGQNTHFVTKSNTAFCGDGRLTVRFAQTPEGHIDDTTAASEIVVPQLFGGVGLSATKACVAANATIIHGATSFTEAYRIVSASLFELPEKIEDAGHEDCGASGNVLSSVENEIPGESLIQGIGLFIPTTEEVIQIAGRNAVIKQRRLQAGFYADWSPADHADYLTSRYPQNFTYLKGDDNDHVAHGHHESGVYVITGDQQGFAKNQFIQNTDGKEAFAVTAWMMQFLARKLGASEEERTAILVGFIDDTLHVGAGLVKPGMPVFAHQQ